jgi:hypothetical protein
LYSVRLRMIENEHTMKWTMSFFEPWYPFDQWIHSHCVFLQNALFSYCCFVCSNE